MATEIERKFLVKGDDWRKGGRGMLCRQGYLSTDKERIVRIRTAGKLAFITVKGITRGISRAEYEYEIPLQDANEMLDQLCEGSLIKKYRYEVEHGSMLWEVDEFLDENEGLLLAEVELEFEEQEISLPEWVGEEVSGDSRYDNANLAKNPYSGWK